VSPRAPPPFGGAARELSPLATVRHAVTVDVVGIAQQSRTAAAFEAGVVASLERAIGFDAAFFVVRGFERPGVVVGIDEKTQALMALRGSTYEVELMPVKRAALAARGVAVDTDVCGLEHVRRTHYHREIARTIGGQHSLLAYVPWRGTIVGALMLGRVTSTFARREVELMESLLPALGVARAAFGTPWLPAPLPQARAEGIDRFLPWAGKARVLASRPSACGTLTVRDRDGFREMVATNGASELVWTRTSLPDPRRSGWPYVELLHLAATLAERRGRALFVGCGGGVSVGQFASTYPGIAIDVVEHELEVVELARTWFGLDAVPNTTIHVADGASFIERAEPGSWDVVVLDAYDASSSTSAFATRDFFTALKRALRRGGALACNVIGVLGRSGPVSDVVSAARSVFRDVRVHPVLGPNELGVADALRNVVVVAKRD